MNILITGIVRNCAKTIHQEYKILDESFSDFGKAHWFLVESDSTDQSIQILETIRQKDQLFQFESLGFLANQVPERTERLAYCRNRYLLEIAKTAYQHIDFVVVADLDFANRLLTKESVNKAFSLKDWDVLTANQRGPYYDVLALRQPLWCNDDCESSYSFLRNFGISHIDALNAAILSKMITIPPNAPLIPVESAFGGLAIYRREVLLSRQYFGKSPAGDACCEHVPLNQSIAADGYKIFINPALINNSYNEHNRRKLWYLQFLRKLSSIFKSTH